MDEQELDPMDPADAAFVRALLAEAGREPELLPDDVAARLDATLAGLSGERALDDPAPPAVVPLERARQRRRRGLQTLVAAAAVVVGGYTVTTTGLLTTAGGGDSGSAGGVTTMDDSADAGSSGGDLAPELSDADGFPMASGSLRADARRLVASDRDRTVRRVTGLSATKDGSTANQYDGATRSPQAGAEADSGGTDDLSSAPSPQDASRCLDPLVPARLPRLAVSYDGRAATAVLRPLRSAPDGAGRVRVEVWDCAAPVRLAAVVVRR